MLQRQFHFTAVSQREQRCLSGRRSMPTINFKPVRFFALIATLALPLVGCSMPSLRKSLCEISASDIPRELEKVSIPSYRVEPPDILLIEAVNNIRPANDPLHVGDHLAIRVANALPPDPQGDPTQNEFKLIREVYQVQTDGSVNLGPEYGVVKIEGLTLTEARAAIDKHLRDVIGLASPKIAISMPDVNGKQQIAGEHLVRPDGTVALGVYGNVYVSGLTLDEVKAAVEQHLSKSIHKPEINVDVLAYNSKVIYVVTDGGGQGEQVDRLPFTGNETVLDAISQIQGLSDVSSKEIWVARPAPADTACAQTMRVDWRAITQDGVTDTNYQLLPGDRIYIKADPWISLDNVIVKVTQPAARLFGFVALGNGTVQQTRRGKNTNGSGGGGFY